MSLAQGLWAVMMCFVFVIGYMGALALLCGLLDKIYPCSPRGQPERKLEKIIDKILAFLFLFGLIGIPILSALWIINNVPNI